VTDRFSPKGREVLAELISTEESYHRNLCDVLDIYVADIRRSALGLDGNSASAKLGLTIEQIDTVFGPNLEEIRTLSGKFLASLRKSQKASPDNIASIIDVFLDLAPEMHHYAPYNSSYHTAYMCLKSAMGAVENVRKSPFSNKTNFVQRWNSFSAKYLNNETFMSFLIKPVQRIPRYTLLLRELVKSLPEDDVENKLTLSETHKVYELVAREINESVRAHEKLLRIFGEELKGPTMSMSRRSTQNRNSGSIKIKNIYVEKQNVHPSGDLDTLLELQTPENRKKLYKIL